MIRIILQNGNGEWRATIIGLCFYVFAVLSALILHEVAHGFVASRCGDPTSKFAGRLNLNPANHLDPLGAVCFLVFGFGWAKPVPINPYNFRKFRLGCFLVSIAGIITNLLVGFTASFFWVLLYDSGSVWLTFFEYMLVMNVSFAVFNLLPVPPLDGFNIWASLCKPNNKIVVWLRDNQMVLFLIILLIIQLTATVSIMMNGVLNIFLAFWGLIL